MAQTRSRMWNFATAVKQALAIILAVLGNMVEETKSLLRNSRTHIPYPGNVQFRNLFAGTTVSCFVAYVTTMTVHMFHGEPDPTINVEHLSLGDLCESWCRVRQPN